MLYIIFNSDGSIKEQVVGESIQQGDHLTKQIFIAIDGLDNTEYTCSGDFVLPNGTLSEMVATQDTDAVYGDGYSVTLTEAQTLYAGNLKVNFRCVDLQSHVLCTYQITLKINPTGYDPNETNITEAQYNAFLQSLNSYLTLLQGDARYVKKTDLEFKIYYHKITIQTTAGSYVFNIVDTSSTNYSNITPVRAILNSIAPLSGFYADGTTSKNLTFTGISNSGDLYFIDDTGQQTVNVSAATFTDTTYEM